MRNQTLIIHNKHLQVDWCQFKNVDEKHPLEADKGLERKLWDDKYLLY